MGTIEGRGLLHRMGSSQLDSSYVLASTMPSSSPKAKIWRFKAPQTVITFGWMAFLLKTVTMDNLIKCNLPIVNGCPMCLLEAETVDHCVLY